MSSSLSKTKLSIGIVCALVLVGIAIAFQSGDSEAKPEEPEIMVQADVVMPTKVSRPGCEEIDSCYVPSIFTVKQGKSVTWYNSDVAFHSVTSGIYGSPDDLFDSGHLDPEEKFSYTFSQTGTFDYFCTLHPWMAGKILVE